MSTEPSQPDLTDGHAASATPADGGAIWFVLSEGANFGPYTVSQMVEFAQTCNINEQSMIWREGLQDWISADSAVGLFQNQASSPSQAKFPAQPRHPQSRPTAPPLLTGRHAAAVYRTLISTRKKSKPWKLIGLGLYVCLGIIPLIVGASWKSVREKVYSLGDEQYFQLDFSGGIDGKWRGEALEVKEAPLRLARGEVINWKFDRVRTSESTWSDQIHTKKSDSKLTGYGCIYFILPKDPRLVGQRLNFSVSMAVTRPEIAGSNSFQNATFDHFQECEALIGTPIQVRSASRMGNLAAFGLIVTVIGAWIMLQIAKHSWRT